MTTFREYYQEPPPTGLEEAGSIRYPTKNEMESLFDQFQHLPNHQARQQFLQQNFPYHWLPDDILEWLVDEWRYRLPPEHPLLEAFMNPKIDWQQLATLARSHGFNQFYDQLMTLLSYHPKK
ncbi:hypothetical protein KCM76_12095 [Zooshikella marina]|uniref:hypothetical protein n=1 Tax=Zooshikella ganghwensis TaxID=202772 RepID=UPI001BB05E1B|nr:hypothetical protein [Zooshikella ganghwensis]MBU2706725.1 hypothetical protein [Zooshikella ganghwensis]